jgi:hypothetical protein
MGTVALRKSIQAKGNAITSQYQNIPAANIVAGLQIQEVK